MREGSQSQQHRDCEQRGTKHGGPLSRLIRLSQPPANVRVSLKAPDPDRPIREADIAKLRLDHFSIPVGSRSPARWLLFGLEAFLNRPLASHGPSVLEMQSLIRGRCAAAADPAKLWLCRPNGPSLNTGGESVNGARETHTGGLQSANDTLSALGSSRQRGLDDAEAASRLERDGPNEVPLPAPSSGCRHVLLLRIVGASTAPRLWHSRAGGGAVHSIISRRASYFGRDEIPIRISLAAHSVLSMLSTGRGAV